MTSRYRYLHLDVFTGEKFGGNQLAVFLDARGLAAETMQAVTKEMNFSESTFILPAERPDTDIRMRIFTPGAGDAHGGPPDGGIHVRAGACRRDSRGPEAVGLRPQRRADAGRHRLGRRPPHVRVDDPAAARVRADCR